MKKIRLLLPCSIRSWQLFLTGAMGDQYTMNCSFCLTRFAKMIQAEGNAMKFKVEIDAGSKATQSKTQGS